MEIKTPQGNTKRPNRKLVLVVFAVLAGSVVFCCGVGTWLLGSAIQEARAAARRRSEANDLKQIGEALRNYQDTYQPSVDHGDGDGDDKAASRAMLTKTQIADLATGFKETWLVEHGDGRSEFEKISATEKDGGDWRVTFEATSKVGESAGKVSRDLVIHLDSEGKLIKIELGASEVPDKQ